MDSSGRPLLTLLLGREGKGKKAGKGSPTEHLTKQAVLVEINHTLIV